MSYTVKDFKVGDKVVIREDIAKLETPSSPAVAPDMERAAGTECTVHKIDGGDLNLKLENGDTWYFRPEWVTPVSKKVTRNMNSYVFKGRVDLVRVVQESFESKNVGFIVIGDKNAIVGSLRLTSASDLTPPFTPSICEDKNGRFSVDDTACQFSLPYDLAVIEKCDINGAITYLKDLKEHYELQREAGNRRIGGWYGSYSNTKPKKVITF